MYLNNRGSKVVLSRLFYLSKSPCNYWHTIVLTWVRMITSEDIKCVLVECNSFVNHQKKTKFCIVMMYIRIQIYECDEIKDIQCSNDDCLGYIC